MTTESTIRKRRWWYATVAALALAALSVAAQPAHASGPPPITWLGGGQVGVLATAVSPDQQTIAVAGGDNTVKLWRIADHRLIRTFAGHLGGVSTVAFTPDGQYLVSGGEFVFGSSDGDLKLWRVADGATLKVLTGHRSILLSVAFSPDGRTLASGGVDTTVRLWRTSDFKLIRVLQHTDTVNSVAFSASAYRYSPSRPVRSNTERRGKMSYPPTTR